MKTVASISNTGAYIVIFVGHYDHSKNSTAQVRKGRNKTNFFFAKKSIEVLKARSICSIPHSSVQGNPKRIIDELESLRHR